MLKTFLGESNSNDAVTLSQYKSIVDAGLTKSQGCAGIASGEQGLKGAASLVMQALLAGLLMAWLLVDV